MASAVAGARTIKASVLHAAKTLKIDERVLPRPSPHELQVAIATTGLCGSDLHYFQHYRNGDIQVHEPMSLGHESAGVVMAIGSAVPASIIAVGDHVALEVGLPCETCERCVEGRYNICHGMRFRSSAKNGVPHAQGTMQERINHPAKWCHRLPRSLPLTLGALLEPLSVAIHACRRAGLNPTALLSSSGSSPTGRQSIRSSALVFGAGAVGLLVAAMVKLAGISTVVIADIDGGRVDFAVRNGFAHRGFVVPPTKPASTDEAMNIAKSVAASTARLERWGEKRAVEEFDSAFECTGVPAGMQACIFAARPGGKVLMIGMGTPIQTLPISAAALREVDLVGVFRYANDYQTGIQIVSSEASDVPDFVKLITHRFTGLEQAEKAFDMAGRTKDRHGRLVLKVMLELDGAKERARL